MGRPPKELQPPTLEQIKEALETSGYPLELRVYRTFEAAEMDPALSFRYRAAEDDPQTKEIDVLARLHARKQYEDGQFLPTATVTLLFPTEVKRLHKGAFVGMVGRTPTTHERRVQRAAPAAGVPCWQIADIPYDGTVNNLLIGDGGLSECFDPVNERPYCVQWATVATDKQGKRFEARHDDGCADDLQRLIRSTALLARERAITSLNFAVDVHERQGVMPEVTFFWPLLVVDAPIYVYDTESRNLAESEWITLHVGTDLAGQAHYRPIDIVTPTGLNTIIKSYKLVIERVVTWLETRVHEVKLAAAGQVVIHKGRRARSEQYTRSDFPQWQARPLRPPPK